VNFAPLWDDEHRKRLMRPSQIDGRIVSFARRLCPKKLPGDVRLLDVGCGAGFNAFWLADRDYCVDAFDSSPAAIKRMQSEMHSHRGRRPDCIVHDVTKLFPYDDNTFDGAFDLRTLENLEHGEIADAFCEIRRVLKRGGQFMSIMANTERNDELTTVGKVFKAGPDDVQALCSHAGFSSVGYVPDRVIEDGKKLDEWRIEAIK
jgi:SAM-dependent methyltransferase